MTGPDSADPAAEPAPLEGRIALDEGDLRARTARGTLINAAFSVGLAGLGLSRRVLVAAFLTASEFGLWGLIFVSVTTILWFKEIGVSDKFIQQSERDQEAAFQKAFTLNLLWTSLFFLVVLGAVPVLSVLYGRPEIVGPGFVLSLAVLATALQSPTWIFYRQMRFVRQRTLLAVDPVVGFVVTIGLGVAGAGVWSLVLGAIAGTWSGGVAALLVCPYRIRLRLDRGTLREYFRFSWPLLVSTGSGVIVVQTAVVVGNATVGLAGVGAIGLAGAIAGFANRVERIVTQTLYPAICAVRDRTDLLFESFAKSNRLALMWGMPFGLGLALFAPDLVSFVLGEKWRVAVGLLQVFGVLTAVRQIAFNWTAFHRALNDTRPIGLNGLLGLVTFMAVGVPLMLAHGLTGYAIGMVAMTAVQMIARTYFLSRLFSGFEMLRHSLRAIAPSVPAVGAVLVVRLADATERTSGTAIAELALYVAVTGLTTWLLERDLLREAFGYLRRTPRAPTPA